MQPPMDFVYLRMGEPVLYQGTPDSSCAARCLSVSDIVCDVLRVQVLSRGRLCSHEALLQAHSGMAHSQLSMSSSFWAISSKKANADGGGCAQVHDVRRDSRVATECLSVNVDNDAEQRTRERVPMECRRRRLATCMSFDCACVCPAVECPPTGACGGGHIDARRWSGCTDKRYERASLGRRSSGGKLPCNNWSTRHCVNTSVESTGALLAEGAVRTGCGSGRVCTMQGHRPGVPS